MLTRWNNRLKNVTWGYRDKFEKVLQNLKESGQLDLPEDDPSVMAFDKTFMEIVGKDYCTDTAANYFLESLDKRLCWIISYPELLEAWAEYGLKLLDKKLYYAIRYFELWNRKLNVTGPEEMSFIMSSLRLVEDRIGISAALAFLQGYGELKKELSRDNIHSFIEEGIGMFSGKQGTAEKFFRLELASSRRLIEIISKRCCLKDIKSRLERLFKSVLDMELQIEDTSKLDSDELIEKGSTVVCFCNSIFFPAKVTAYDSSRLNTEWYLASAYSNAFALLFNGFPSVHALPGFESSEVFLDSIGMNSDLLSRNLFCLLDVYHVFSRAFEMFPGAGSLIRRVLVRETELHSDTVCIFDKLIGTLLCGEQLPDETACLEDFCSGMKESCKNIENFYEAARKIPQARQQYFKALGNGKTAYGKWSGCISFYSDYDYHTGMSHSNKRDASLVMEENENKTENNKKENKKASLLPAEFEDWNTSDSGKREENESTGYMYDEWNNESREYFNNWCCLNEINEFYGGNECSIIVEKERIRSIRNIFERLKPEIMKARKNLSDGEDLILDSMITYISERRAGLSPEENIYKKSIKDERDVATALLMDISGSTGEDKEQNKVIDIERDAVCLLAEGLNELDDRFAIYGFSGYGRKNCMYYVFKGFDEDWGSEQRHRLASSRPVGSTRIGPAIRHTAEKLKGLENKTKLILLITDGKPQDSDGYTSEGYYAQHDVHMACVEAKRAGINVFCLSTEDNALNELELMFPARKYVIIKDVSNLPKLLAASYIKLTL